jgi:hypothetical protein
MRHASAPARLLRQVLVVLSRMAVAGLVSAGPAAPANGGSVSIGFNGTDTGQAPAPTALYVNGTVATPDESYTGIQQMRGCGSPGAYFVQSCRVGAPTSVQSAA